MHQMIPHHENAVNMAKVLLLNPGDEDLDEEVNQIRSEIHNGRGRIRDYFGVGTISRVLTTRLHEVVYGA